MSDLAVSYSQLNDGASLLERQHGHLERMAGYLETQGRLASPAPGRILQVLQPLGDEIADAGAQALRAAGRLAQWGSEGASATLHDYVDADRRAYEALRALSIRFGDDALSPFPDLDDTGKVAATAGPGETIDPVSHLIAPQPAGDPVMELCRRAQLLLGDVDHIAETLLGYRILDEYVAGPLGGDWGSVDAASQAWAYEADAVMEVAANVSMLSTQLDGWKGEGADAFGRAMTAISGGAVALGYAFEQVSSRVAAVQHVAARASAGITLALQRVSERLRRMLVESSIPTGGATAAGEAADALQKVFFYLRTVNTLIGAILDAVDDLADARQKLMRAVIALEDLVVAANRAVQ